jgi:hypothetical protein
MPGKRMRLVALLLCAVGATAGFPAMAAPHGSGQPARQAPKLVALFAASKSGTGVRIDKDLVVIAVPAANGDPVSLSAPASTAEHHSKVGKTVSAPIRGTVLASDADGFVLARMPAAGLDAAGLPIATISRADAKFGDSATIASPSGNQVSATLESSRRLFILPRSKIQVSGTQPASGGALFNGCDQLVGMLAGSGKPATHAEATTLATIQNLIDKAAVKVTVASKACDTPGDGLGRLSNRFAADSQSARAQAAAADTAIRDLKQQLASGRFGQGGKSGAEARLATLTTESDKARAAAGRSDAAVERIKTYRRWHDRSRVIAVLLLVLAVALAGAAVVLLRRNRGRVRDREESIAILTKKRNDVDQLLNARPWRDVVLQGDSGILKISAVQLSEGGTGAVIGRSEASADVTFSPADISRRHAKLFVRDNMLWVVDLGSVGGTSINGRRVDSEAPVSLSTGDEVQLASHRFKVRIL